MRRSASFKRSFSIGRASRIDSPSEATRAHNPCVGSSCSGRSSSRFTPGPLVLRSAVSSSDPSGRRRSRRCPPGTCCAPERGGPAGSTRVGATGWRAGSSRTRTRGSRVLAAATCRAGKSRAAEAVGMISSHADSGLRHMISTPTSPRLVLVRVAIAAKPNVWTRFLRWSVDLQRARSRRDRQCSDSSGNDRRDRR